MVVRDSWSDLVDRFTGAGVVVMAGDVFFWFVWPLRKRVALT